MMLSEGMRLVLYPDYAVADAEGTFQISSIEDEDGNDLASITDILTENGYRDYLLEDEHYIIQIKKQLRANFDAELVDTLIIELGEWA